MSEEEDIWNETDKTLPRDKARDQAEDPEEFYKAGLFLLNRNRQKEALAAFRQAFELKKTDPRYMSYFGLCLARTGGRVKEGLALCEKAAEKEFFRSELFHNLSQAYLRAGNRRKAYEALRKGMSLDKTNKDIVGELEKMGIRKTPVFPFLDRKNTLNKFAGKILYRLRLRR